MAGPIDYIEHRSPGRHMTDNWRHRYFAGLGISILCPTCLNLGAVGPHEIMRNNSEAVRSASLFIAHFPGDVATFGTPIEVWEWATTAFQMSRDPGLIIHPARPGIIVRHLEETCGLSVVRTFEEARSWLAHRL
jgi:hypothetical protein